MIELCKCGKILHHTGVCFGNIPWSKGKKLPSLNKFTPPKDLTEDLSYVLGVIMGDGCISDKKSSVFVLYANDEEFVEKTKSSTIKYIHSIKKKKPDFSVKQDKNKMFFFTLYSKDFVEWAKKLTNNKQNVPELVKSGTRKIKLAFLKGLFDSEGHYYVSDKTETPVSFSVSHPFIYEVKQLLDSINIKCSNVHTYYNDITIGKYFYPHHIQYRINVNPVSFKEIGFTIKRKQKMLNLREKFIKRRSFK
jgi:intein/homing endonuclease